MFREKTRLLLRIKFGLYNLQMSYSIENTLYLSLFDKNNAMVIWMIG